MDEQFIRDRITALRLKKNVSEYKMSLDLGHSSSYINGISSGKALPSMSEFLYICKYFDISPKEFFSPEITEPQLVSELYKEVNNMSQDDLSVLLNLAKRLNSK